VHGFPDPAFGRAVPYGIYGLTGNPGRVSVGIGHDTATFAVETLRRWWLRMGRDACPDAARLLVTADGGGADSSRSRLWKRGLQKSADQQGLKVSVCHFPPGTSRWNRIEHRMSAWITRNRRGRPLTGYQVAVNLTAATRTKTGLAIQTELDEGVYPLAVKVTDEEMKALNIRGMGFHGEWNHTLVPRQ